MKGLAKIISELIHKFFLKKDTGGIYYVGGNDILPPPLEPSEEAELIARLSDNGDEVRQILIERNLRLVVYIAKKFESSGVGTEDLVSIGAIGLIKAINTFKAEKKIKLATYASRCIENEILMYLRKNNGKHNEISRHGHRTCAEKDKARYERSYLGKVQRYFA